ncbi:MAG TPA: peptide deformylase [Gemmatimonadales bacterium]|nr:peptide deformylase [Gemmatimonadales bacterium]
MSVRALHLLGSPALRERAAEVGQPDEAAATLVRDLLETMRAAQGVGLAANQVGVTRRVAVVDTGEDGMIVLIDPIIVERYGLARDEEGCLSIPDLYGEVERSTRVVVETTTLAGARERVEALDLRARAVQHEIDHLDGILFIDHLSPLKRQLLMRRWRKQRAGQTGYLKELPAAPVRG